MVAVEEIERRAAGVLADVPGWLWDGGALPVPVQEIAESCFDLLVRDTEDMAAAPEAPPIGDGQSLSGLFLPLEREIWVNAAETRQWPPRRRFTIGHELGHCVLHQGEQRSLFCRHGQIDAAASEAEAEAAAPPPPERPPLDPIEEEANFFAAALLMPAELIERHYRSIGAVPDRFDRMCEIFGSSRRAMQKRLQQVI